jgi:hypothetical protein
MRSTLKKKKKHKPQQAPVQDGFTCIGLAYLVPTAGSKDSYLVDSRVAYINSCVILYSWSKSLSEFEIISFSFIFAALGFDLRASRLLDRRSTNHPHTQPLKF